MNKKNDRKESGTSFVAATATPTPDTSYKYLVGTG